MTLARTACLLLLVALPMSAFAQAAIVARNGRAVVQENAPATTAFQLAATDVPDVDAAVLTIVAPPARGAAVVQGARIVYTPDADTGGEDRIGYRVCDGADCDEAIVFVSVRPQVGSALSRLTAATSGSFVLPVDGLRALPSARFETTGLAEADIRQFDLGVDPTPRTPFDGSEGTFWDTRTLPLGAAATKFVVIRPIAGDAEIAIGLDADGDGQPSEAEIACITDGSEDCILEAPGGPGTAAYWWLAHNTGDSSDNVRFELYEVVRAGDGSLFATGAGHVERDEAFPLRIGYVDDTFNLGEYRLGMITVRSDADTVVGSFPVRLRPDPAGFQRSPVQLLDGRAHAFVLAGGEENRSIFIDVPEGATHLQVSLTSDVGVDLYLVPQGNAVLTDSTSITPSPDTSLAFDSDTGPNPTKNVEITGAQVQSGRWYVVPANRTQGNVQLQMTADIDAVAPIVRDGSYFNERRSGHGLFLYPADTQWTGLWYAYDREGLPTWYYLQATLPGPDGLWTSEIYRSTWDGDSNTLVAVGDLTITPNGDDKFVMSYRIDGQTGSEQMGEFGRGCPMNGTYDLSSTWFDPLRAGSGYSIQFFPDYEFFAAFVYDDRGYSRFVAAELDRFGGTEPTLVMHQVRGACPTCTYVPPVRTDIGTLRRRILSGTLQTITTDLEFAPPLSGGWTATDSVQLLGGPGTTQGCDP